MPTERWRPRSRASTTVTAHSRSASRTGPCSVRGRSTSASSNSASDVRKLDPPVIAALRLGALPARLVGSGGPRRHRRCGGVVRAARRERAVPFTNAVMRRLATGLNGLVASLPEGALKHSYPDWIAEIWERDFGREDALALMRAQNERPALEVRSAEPVGTPTDVPGAYTVDHVDPERMRPMSRASQLAAIVVGARPGERILDGCAAPGGKSEMLAGEVTAVEINPGRARAIAEEMPGERARGSGRPARARRARLRPSARRCSVLRPRSARPPPRPALAGATAAGAAARVAAGGGRAREARGNDRLCGLHAERG